MSQQEEGQQPSQGSVAPVAHRKLGIAVRCGTFAALFSVGLLIAPSASPTPSHSRCGADNETMCGDGGAATQARLLRPLAVSARPGGGFLIADAGNHAIRAVSAQGVITTVAGLGSAGYRGDHGPSIAAQLDTPTDVAARANGAILIADTGNNVIRRVGKRGEITTIAGSGRGGGTEPSTTPTPATTVQLAGPRGLALLQDGGYLIADTDANLVLRVSASGQLQIAAGTGSAGYSGDGGQADLATLNAPTRVVPIADGGFLILDQGNDVVRRVSSSGIISSVPGTTATLSHDLFGQLTVNPGGLTIDSAGDLFLFDDRQVVEVTPTGQRTVIAGTGDCGSSGDGGAAVDATFATPSGLANTDRGLLVVDYNNQAVAAGNIRLIDAGGTISTVAGEADTGGCVGAGAAPTGALWPIFYITAPHAVHAHRPIVVKFASTRTTVVRTSIFRHGRRIRTARRTCRVGLNSVTLAPGVVRGKYRMEIAASANVKNNNEDEGGILKLNKRFAAHLTVRR